MDLLELVPGGADALIGALRSMPAGTVLPPMRPWLAMPLDSVSDVALVSALHKLEVVGIAGAVDAEAARKVADTLALVRDVTVETRRRTPPAAASLVMTSAEADHLRNLRRVLGIQPLVQHLENVIRDARGNLVLLAPYWNLAGLESLRPAIEGALNRNAGRLTLIAQGGSAQPTAQLDVIRRFVEDLTLESHRAELLVFKARSDTGAEVFLHAKAALADNEIGYLGSANMTSQGFATNLEIGVRLTPADVVVLRNLLTRFVELGFLRPAS